MTAKPERIGPAGLAPNTPPAAPVALPPAAQPAAARHHADLHPTGRRLAVLTLGALGVVYGDIGTSPLYALRECFSSLYGLSPSPANVYGVLSLIIWAILLVVAVKYIVVAGNRSITNLSG